jgi:hypothetical protein
MEDRTPGAEALPSAWRGGEDGFTRTFELEDEFAPHHTAGMLAHVAGRRAEYPRYVLEGRTLRVSLATVPAGSRAAFAAEADTYFRKIREGVASPNPRPATALVRLWLEAQDRWEEAVRRLSPGDMDRPTHSGAAETIFTEAVRHPLRAGFGYLAWIRHARRLADTRPPHSPDEVQGFTGPDQVLATLPALRKDLEATLTQLTEGAMFDGSYQSAWGEVFTVEQMIEHAIVHFHRHRLQIEGYLATRTAPDGG